MTKSGTGSKDWATHYDWSTVRDPVDHVTLLLETPLKPLTRKFRLLDTRWSSPDQFEMLRFQFVDWTWLLHYKYLHAVPPGRGDVKLDVPLVLSYEPGHYDAVILHIDDSCLDPTNTTHGKWVICRDIDAVVTDIPKILITHGVPHASHGLPRPSSTIERQPLPELMKLIRKSHVVAPSRHAATAWGCTRVIPHGVNPRNWLDLPKLPRVMIATGSARNDKAQELLRSVREMLRFRGIEAYYVADDYRWANCEQYRTTLGRTLIYFTPTDELPMPHVRTEAMLSGCCVITHPTHDAEEFIVDGVNGFISGWNAVAIVDLIEELLANPRLAIAIGQRGKETASSLFSISAFGSRWLEFLQTVTKL